MTSLVAQQYYIGFDRPMIINARKVRVDSTRLGASNNAHRLERSRPIDLLFVEKSRASAIALARDREAWPSLGEASKLVSRTRWVLG